MLSIKMLRLVVLTWALSHPTVVPLKHNIFLLKIPAHSVNSLEAQPLP